MTGWRLLTGATGQVGQPLLARWLAARLPTAVLVRCRRQASARARIDDIVSSYEERWQRYLPRPVVLEGNLAAPGLGLSPADRDWMQRHVTSVVHSGASLKFEADEQGEPMNSNAGGTAALLELCHTSRVTQFHYISTAYACGQQTGRVPERFHGTEIEFGNIYERSKALAEQLVLSAPGAFSRTIYRPSIIIGDAVDGRCVTYHTVYTPLRVLAAAQQAGGIPLSSQHYLRSLGFRGAEGKNLVPYDWVVEALAALIEQPRFHNTIYHLTNPRPTTVQLLMRALRVSLGGPEDDPADAELEAPVDSSATKSFTDEFKEELSAYRSYWRADPEFDLKNLRGTAAVSDCPPITFDHLVTTFRAALAANFRAAICPGSAAGRASDLQQTAKHLTEQLTAQAARQTSTPWLGPTSPSVRLTLSGPSGGTWDLSSATISAETPALVVTRPSHEAPLLEVVGAGTAVARWLLGRTTLETLLHAGAITLLGPRRELRTLDRLVPGLQHLLSEATHTSSERPALDAGDSSTRLSTKGVNPRSGGLRSPSVKGPTP